MRPLTPEQEEIAEEIYEQCGKARVDYYEALEKAEEAKGRWDTLTRIYTEYLRRTQE